jgi:type I restriction enzyme R subunit
VEKLRSEAAKADTIAHRTMRTITDRMQEDPAFYRKFSELLQETIRAFREGRIKEVEYLKRVQEIMNFVINRTGDDIPETLKYKETAMAYYGVVSETMEKYGTESSSTTKAAEKISLVIDEIIKRLRIVSWNTNIDIQNQMRNKIEDFIFEIMNEYKITLTFEDIDSIMDQCLDIAKVRIP